ncbi:NB-ARC domain-containing protein [Mycena sanguinolenta]|uniref:NB-ARC domain-containing protein n=1 Tax=Mycena sanguinolenta TaxID=230812 RepID=A0A8H6XHL5_9AGAR|nr:NB-ARC domain-containing protein [Mycena sanguinolenta]
MLLVKISNTYTYHIYWLTIYEPNRRSTTDEMNEKEDFVAKIVAAADREKTPLRTASKYNHRGTVAFKTPHYVTLWAAGMSFPTHTRNPGKADTVLRYATVAASTLNDLAQSAPIPFLRTIAAVSLSILTIAESVKSNKEQCMRMVSQIDELLSAILHLCVESDSAEDTLSPATLHNIGKFADTLQKIHSFIEAQQKNSKFRRFFRQSENTAQLEVCNAGLRHALDVFGVRNSLIATTELADIREQAEKRHEELVQLFAGKSEAMGSYAVSEISKSLFSLGNSVGLEQSRNASKHLLRYFSQSPASILVLDNLETCWEPLDSRNDVEEFLSLLTDIMHLALLITMRGAERPSKVRWTRPFMSPLPPLSDDAAMQTFTDITDYLDHDKRTIREILGLTDNLPLAINLVANIAAFEGHETVLSRWRDEKTTLFSEGRDKCSNLDLSIQLSLSSPRMADSPGAHQLLSLLSLLPDGILEPELLQCDLLIPDMGRSKTTLIRTSLAYVDHGKRLRVLVPIREYIQKYSPPSPTLCRPPKKALS